MQLVVLLRGLNVGGRRSFRPSELARQLEHLEVVNIGAAGTLVVRRPVSRARVRAEIARRLPFEAEIVVCTGQEIARLRSRDWFSGHPLEPDVVRFVSVLSRAPRATPRLPIELPADGRWLLRVLARHGRFVVGLHRRHMRVIGLLGSLDRLFGVPVTTRSWGTIVEVARVLDGGAA